MAESEGTSSFHPDEKYLFRVLMDNISDSVYFKDRESRFIAISRYQANKFGIDDPEEAKGKTDFDFFSEEHARQAYEDEQEIIRTGNPVVGKEEKETWGDREDRWVTTTKMPLKDPDGNVIGTFGISRDITAKKQFQIKLEESEAKLKEHVKRMEQDLRRAQIMLNAILPATPPSTERFSVAFRYRHADSISGDYISFFPLRREGLGIFLGNVSGKGVSAAMFVGLLKFLTDYVAEEFSGDPTSFIEALNEDLESELPAVSVAAVYGCFRAEKRGGASFEFAAGGQPAPVVVRSNGEVSILSPPGSAALGAGNVLEPDYAKVTLEQGDRLLLYSDGLSRAIFPPGQEGTVGPLSTLLKSCRRDELEATLDAILAAADEQQDSAAAADDILLCAVEVR